MNDFTAKTQRRKVRITIKPFLNIELVFYGGAMRGAGGSGYRHCEKGCCHKNREYIVLRAW